MLKRTSLFEEHQRLGGRLIDFGGWELPVQYSGVIEEHQTCRSAAGLFDVSHMGEVHVEGIDAENYLNFLVTNNVSKLAVGQAQYTVMCHENGGIVDDLVIYRRAQDRFLVVVNAANTDKDFKHMMFVKDHRLPHLKDLQVTNQSSQYSQIAIQGPQAASILSKITPVPLETVKTYWFVETTLLNQIPVILGRTGYTGEDGFEIYSAWESGPEIWKALLEAGAASGIKPCGLGARDTLRLEMKYPLYGNELTDDTHPLEAGLGWVVKFEKGDFLGRAAILKAKEEGLKRQLVGIRVLGKNIPRHGYSLFTKDGVQRIGELTSGTQAPSLNLPIGIAYVDLAYSKTGTSLTVDIRGNKIPAEVVATPFYKRPY